MANFVEYNANYYNNDIGDCVVRAISMGTNIGYVTICKMLHKEFKKGFGMLGSGVSLAEIDKFAKETKFISLYDQDSRYVKWLNDKSNKEELRVNFGLPLELWMENVKSGRYVVSTRKPTLDKKEAAKNIHMVYVNCNTQKYYDTWDSGGELIFSVYRIDTRISDTNKYSRKSEAEKLASTSSV